MAVLETHFDSILRNWTCPMCGSSIGTLWAHEEVTHMWEAAFGHVTNYVYQPEAISLDRVVCDECGHEQDPADIYGLYD